NLAEAEADNLLPIDDQNPLPSQISSFGNDERIEIDDDDDERIEDVDGDDGERIEDDDDERIEDGDGDDGERIEDDDDEKIEDDDDEKIEDGDGDDGERIEDDDDERIEDVDGDDGERIDEDESIDDDDNELSNNSDESENSSGDIDDFHDGSYIAALDDLNGNNKQETVTWPSQTYKEFMTAITQYRISDAAGDAMLQIIKKNCTELLPASTRKGRLYMDTMNIKGLHLKTQDLVEFEGITYKLHYRPIIDAIKSLTSNQELCKEFFLDYKE
ncbi:20053_t:CDS:1, partial [Rhizophagus irregularis]